MKIKLAGILSFILATTMFGASIVGTYASSVSAASVPLLEEHSINKLSEDVDVTGDDGNDKENKDTLLGDDIAIENIDDEDQAL